MDVAAVWAVIERIAPRAQIAGALATIEELVPDDDGSAEPALRVVLAQRYRTVRPFLGLLAESISFDAASGGAAVLAAVKTLAELVARKVKLKPLRPAEIDDRLVRFRIGVTVVAHVRRATVIKVAVSNGNGPLPVMFGPSVVLEASSGLCA